MAVALARADGPPRALQTSVIGRIYVIAAATLLVIAPHVRAQQTPTSPASPTSVALPAVPIRSMGQPARWQPYAAALGLFDHRDDGAGASLLAGVHRPLMNPVTGIVGVSGELYALAGGAFSGQGVRLLATSPIFALGAGADWNVSDSRVDFILSYQTALLRGGLLGHGTMLRVDWLPTRARAVGVGVTVPLLRPFAGRTRPRPTDVDLPAGRPRRDASPATASTNVDAELTRVADAAGRLRLYSSVYSQADEQRLRSGATYAAASRAYREGLSRAFGTAAGDPALGETLSQRARAGLLNDVLLPFDGLFGQGKESNDISGLTSRASVSFARWLRDSSRVSAQTRPAVQRTHDRWLGVIEEVHRQLRGEWKDSRTIWLPLQLALTPDQFNEQIEVDSLIARIVGRPFTDQNALILLRSSDLPLEIARSIFAARDYHVLWTHDFAGKRDKTKVLDNVSYEMVSDVYLPALVEAVKRYDSTGRLTAFMIFIDEFFYEPRAGRIWMSILENPLNSSMRLPRGNAAREAHLRQRQAELRTAVAASRRLQQEASRSGGSRWLRKVVRVHVNVVHPADFSFRSHRIVPPIPFTPDNIMRDHRKIAFYDLTEADPYRGATYLMGVGIGEHYASSTWEDRGYRIRGPAAIEVRAAARRELRRNGFREDEIPPPLREVTSAPAAERRANLGDYIGRALQVHNEVGFGAKESSVTRALLYDLVQPGSVVIVPDPLWLGAEWAGMLAGAAARGARVQVIAPAVHNAPSPEAPILAVTHDVMLRLVQMRDQLSDRIGNAGGALRIGLFAGQAHVDDAAGRRREVREGLQRAPWIREIIPFDAQTLAVLDQAETRSAADGRDATNIAHDEKPRPPQLHQKTQLIARPGAIAALVRQPGWEDVLARAMQVQSQQTARLADQLGYTAPDIETDATRSADAMLRGYEQAIPEAERKNVSFYYSLGTQNQDPRGMMLDGEATLLVSGFHAAAGLVDLYYLMARSTWITTPAELDRLLPPRSRLMRRIARLIRPSL